MNADEVGMLGSKRSLQCRMYLRGQPRWVVPAFVQAIGLRDPDRVRRIMKSAWSGTVLLGLDELKGRIDAVKRRTDIVIRNLWCADGMWAYRVDRQPAYRAEHARGGYSVVIDESAGGGCFCVCAVGAYNAHIGAMRGSLCEHVLACLLIERAHRLLPLILTAREK